MTRRQRLGISVGRRIVLLVVAQALMVAVVVGYAAHTLSTFTSRLEYSRSHLLAPAEALSEAAERVAEIKAQLEHQERQNETLRKDEFEAALADVERVLRDYRAVWTVAESPSAEASLLRKALAVAEQHALLEEERNSLALIEDRLARLRTHLAAESSPEATSAAVDDARELKRGVRTLLHTNIRYIAFDQALEESRARQTRTTLIGLGVCSLILGVVLGLHLRSAIGPRLATLARNVRSFQETGHYERMRYPGRDEIGVLANALDVGFSAIRERDRERQRFLAVAAHELKTPLTSVVGYAEAALATSDVALQHRALEVVKRQGNRLVRLVQDLLLAASARRGDLAFSPKPVDGIVLVRKALAELEVGRERFEFDGSGQVFFLGDEGLLSHAISQLLSFAAAVADKGSVARVAIERDGGQVVFEVSIPKIMVTSDEIENAFVPFATVQYEGGGLRYAVGLYLSREIARLHGGTIVAHASRNDGARLRLQIPA